MDNENIDKINTSASGSHDTTKAYVPYEEIQEKKTTKLGYILLIVMVIIGVSQGQGFIYSLSQNIPYPQSISSCGYYLNNLVGSNGGSSSYRSNYSYYSSDNISNCQYSEIEKKYSIQNVIDEIIPLLATKTLLEKEAGELSNSARSVQSSITTEKQNYSISLQEKIAQEGVTVYNKSQIQNSLTEAESRYTDLSNQLAIKNDKISDISNSISSIAKKNATAISNVFSEYSHKIKVVEFKRALLLLVLISPVLYFTAKRYFKYKAANSQYTIIWAAVTTMFALLFAQVFFVFIYKVLPIELINKLLAFFAQFGFLVTIGQYILLFMVPVIFGGIVFWIQKKVYNKQAVMRRALKNHKCPSCEMTLRESDRYCPVCNYQIKEKCNHCGLDRVVGLAFCSSCGSRND